MIHSAPKYVIACIDFRFQKDFLKVCDEKLGVRSYDYHTFPGASKALIDQGSQNVIIDCIKNISKIHGTKNIIILDHQDCGAYGGSKKFGGDVQKEESFHRQKLQQAKTILKRVFPQMQIKLWYWTAEKVAEVE
jgi:carbonic anhydrase